jgi:hypothetical protein
MESAPCIAGTVPATQWLDRIRLTTQFAMGGITVPGSRPVETPKRVVRIARGIHGARSGKRKCARATRRPEFQMPIEAVELQFVGWRRDEGEQWLRLRRDQLGDEKRALIFKILRRAGVVKASGVLVASRKLARHSSVASARESDRS